MYKRLGLILIGFLTVWLITIFHPVSAQQVSDSSYAERLAQSHQHDRPIATAAVAQAPAIPVTAELVNYGTVDGKTVTGYLARPTNAAKPLPALIVIHEWWGLNDNIKMMTQRLAGEGYTALAVDLYNGQVAQTPEQAKSLVQTATEAPQKLEANLSQAYQYLTTQQQATKIASIGWCFGGSWSLQTALLLPDRLAAAVIYYGGELVTDANRLRSLDMPILGIFGALDKNPSVDTVKTFEAALKSVGKAPEIYIYEGANHAFANSSGTRYNPEAAADAWQKTTAFLARYLKS